jgi:hypothetical protein
MSRAVGRRLVLTLVLLLAAPLAASARPIEAPRVTWSIEEAWEHLLRWFGLAVPKIVWGHEGTDIDPYGRPAPVPLGNQGIAPYGNSVSHR